MLEKVLLQGVLSEAKCPFTLKKITNSAKPVFACSLAQWAPLYHIFW